jgi:hypothetical protein
VASRGGRAADINEFVNGTAGVRRCSQGAIQQAADINEFVNGTALPP